MDKLEYRVGRFTLQPFRQLLEDGVPVSLGRKALDLLSVLARANGALVTKDELLEAVWPNAVVEENAIQVHITALRKVLGEDAQLLTTTRGLGYRLAVTDAGAPPEISTPRPEPDVRATPTPATEGRRRFPWALSAGLVAGVLAVALVLGVLLLDRPQINHGAASAEIPTIAVLSFQPADDSNDAKLFADGLASGIADALSHYSVTVVAPSSSLQLMPSQKPQAGLLLGADFIVDGHIQRNADKLMISSQISDTKKNILVYSFDAEQGPTLSTALAAQIATHLALALDPRKFSSTLGKSFTAEDYALMARANEAMDKWDDLNVMDQLVQLAARHPDDAELQATAAISTIYALPHLPESQQHQLLQKARSDIDRAARLDPQSGRIYFAQSLLNPESTKRATHEALLRKSLELSPNLPHSYDGLAGLMMKVGRVDEGVSLHHRLLQLDPLSVVHASDALYNYALVGRPDEASQLLEQVNARWPDNPSFTFAQYVIAGAAGDIQQVNELQKKLPLPWDLLGIKKEDAELINQALITGDKELVRRATETCFEKFATNLNDGCLSMMVRLKDLDEAFRFAELVYPDNRHLYPADDDRWLTKPALPGLGTIKLFAPLMAPFRDDPRFWPLAVRTGLVEYWQTSQKWPDFCRDRIDTCKAWAAEAMRNRSTVRAAIQQ